MKRTEELRPAKKMGPGYFIREQMELRQWTQEDMAEISGFTVKHINKILTEKQALTLDTARILAEIFNTSAQYWINLDTSYRLWVNYKQKESEIEAELKTRIYERMPIRDMVKKGWLKPFGSAKELVQQVLKFWNISELDFKNLDTQYLPYLTRKSEAYNQFNLYYALAWYRKAQIEAARFKPGTYKKRSLEKLYQGIAEYTRLKNGINLFIQDLSDCGVIFFVLPHLQKTYLDGAAFFHKKNPVIVYTARYNRVDNFWFTIAHEIAHILHHLNDTNQFILDNFKEEHLSHLEKEANELAAEKLCHTEIMNYLDPHLNYLSLSKVEECAETYGVHPSIVIGKLARENKISYGNQNLFREDVLLQIANKFIISPARIKE